MITLEYDEDFVKKANNIFTAQIYLFASYFGKILFHSDLYYLCIHSVMQAI